MSLDDFGERLHKIGEILCGGLGTRRTVAHNLDN
jgi:hypothetical protein